MMENLFKDILSMDGVKGVLLLSFDGELIFKQTAGASTRDPGIPDGALFLEALEGMRETDLLFEKGRLYIRKTEIGYLVIWMGPFVSSAMLRLNCDILLPSLSAAKTPKRRGRFFKQR